MKKLLLLKHIDGRAVILLKNEDQVYDWCLNLPYPEEYSLIYEGKRKKSGHRYELTYSIFDTAGMLYTKHVFCFSKKESVYLAEKIKEINPNYITIIKKLY